MAMDHKITIPELGTQKERFAFLKENHDKLVAQKKGIVKHADGIVLQPEFINEKGDVLKANNLVDTTSLSSIKVKVAINTTNLLDSHQDVHIPGLWNKSLKENKMVLFLKRHLMDFEYIIADGKDLEVSLKTMSWKELGFKFKGETQVLLFVATIKKDRNEFMFNQYAKGYVKNHSVGMRYVRLGLAVNDEDQVARYTLWKEFIDQIANKKAAEELGFFWVVKEAKVIEGSAVPLGSNFATPTLDNNMKSAPPLIGTRKGTPPIKVTCFNYDYLTENY